MGNQSMNFFFKTTHFKTSFIDANGNSPSVSLREKNSFGSAAVVVSQSASAYILAVRENTEILASIIETVKINVINFLCLFQFTADNSRHYFSVDENLFLVPPGANRSSGVKKFIDGAFWVRIKNTPVKLEEIVIFFTNLQTTVSDFNKFSKCFFWQVPSLSGDSVYVV